MYDVLEEAYIFGKKYFPASELAQQIKLKSQKNPIAQQNEYQLEYKVVLFVDTSTSILLFISFVIHLHCRRFKR